MSDSNLPPRIRTAYALGALYRELEEEGIPDDLRYEIVRDAARESTGRGGICVKAPPESADAHQGAAAAEVQA